ncbi:MAG: four-helix bundle copper-binding protein [Actinomycetota bacterium]|nr:four-helix bundle copper-binding protein [Actinomycetota bacterium]
MDAISTIYAQHPRSDESAELFGNLVAKLAECSLVCTICADACANEEGDDLGRCIRLDTDCADLCASTARLLSRQPVIEPDVLERLLTTCAAACQRCAAECRTHAEHHAHCATCAEVCAGCAEACEQAAGRLRTNAES